MTYIQAIIIAIVEGLTEFLPVSSTGHMIITSTLMGIQNETFTKVFEVVIQFGAILSVVVMYFKRFLKSFNFYITLFCAFLPTAILGFTLKKYIDQLMGSVMIVAVMLLVGGIILLFVDKWFAKNELQADNEEGTVSYKQAFFIGIFQALAMVPGVSRSAATIIGGQVQGLTRKVAAEFSFFLAVPTMFAAAAKDIWDEKELIMQSDWKILALGNVVAFIVALLAIRFFINYLTKHGFKMFGYYRIIVGSILIILLLLGYDLKMD